MFFCRHMKTHSDDKPYHCTFPGCGKSFKGKEYLEFHLKSHSDAETPYVCEHPNCNRSFCSSRVLRKHVKLWHHPGGRSSSVEKQLRERIIKVAHFVGLLSLKDKNKDKKYTTYQSLTKSPLVFCADDQ